MKSRNFVWILLSLFWSASALSADALTVVPGGDVGIGTAMPDSALHVKRVDHTAPAQVTVEDGSATVANRILLNLINNGNSLFRLENTNTGTSYEIGTTGANGNFAVFNQGVPLFSLTAAGRFRIGTSSPAALDVRPNGNVVIAGTLTELSDREAKQDIQALEGQYVLAKLDEVPVSQWVYKDDPQARHIGPMAQDFHAAFGLGNNSTSISPRDMAGVNMAAIKALNAKLAEKDAEIAELKSGLAHALASVEAMKVRLQAVEAANPMIEASLK